MEHHATSLLEETPLEHCGDELEKRSIPVTLVSAIIAQEDHRFLSHKGVNWREVKHAFLHNLQRGKVSYGASTIDMQVASLCYLKPRGYNRWIEKLLELSMAHALTARYSKSEIMRAYLAYAPFEDSVRGFVLAADKYFSKSLMDLSFQEEWSLVLALRNKQELSPEKTKTARELPKSIKKQWMQAKWRQAYTIKWQKKRLVLFPYVRNKSFRKDTDSFDSDTSATDS